MCRRCCVVGARGLGTRRRYLIKCTDVTEEVDEVLAASQADAVESWALALDEEGDYDIAAARGCRNVRVAAPDGTVSWWFVEARAVTRVTYTVRTQEPDPDYDVEEA
jgi:hypothetical protein